MANKKYGVHIQQTSSKTPRRDVDLILSAYQTTNPTFCHDKIAKGEINATLIGTRGESKQFITFWMRPKDKTRKKDGHSSLHAVFSRAIESRQSECNRIHGRTAHRAPRVIEHVNRQRNSFEQGCGRRRI